MLFDLCLRMRPHISSRVSLGDSVLVFVAFVALGLVSLALSQEIGWEERLRNDLFCVE